MFVFFTYTIYMSTCTRSRCHSSSHAVQNNHMATLGVMAVTGWWAFTKRTVGRAGCLATKTKTETLKSWSEMITDLWISVKVQFKQHIEDCPLEGWAWGTITQFTEFTEMFFSRSWEFRTIIVLFTEVSKNLLKDSNCLSIKKGKFILTLVLLCWHSGKRSLTTSFFFFFDDLLFLTVLPFCCHLMQSTTVANMSLSNINQSQGLNNILVWRIREAPGLTSNTAQSKGSGTLTQEF